MASIKLISKNYNEKLSSPNTRWVVTADENNLFEVPEWIPQPKPQPDPKSLKRGRIYALDPSILNSPEVITWKILDKSKKVTLKTIKSDVLKKTSITISKKLSGSYSYYLEATNNLGKTAICSLSGSCKQKVTNASWSKEKATNKQEELNYGSAFYVTIDTEGLNGDYINLEIVSKKEPKKILFSAKEECINGTFETRCITTSLMSVKDKKKTEEFIIKLKNPLGKYLKKSNSEDILTFTVVDKTIAPEIEVPKNETATVIKGPDKNSISTGILSLEKIKVDTKYDVCSDEVKDFKDYKNFWILQDNNGKYYHWLKTRNNTVKYTDSSGTNQTIDEIMVKPNRIPITLESTKKFGFKATFKTKLPLDNVQVRVRDTEGKYTFNTEIHPKKNKGEEYELSFVSDNKPYENTVQHLPFFELVFDYSIDGTTWTPMGSSKFEFYITWKEPEYIRFEDFYNYQEKTMQILCHENNRQKNILESLLWIGCKNAKGKGNNPKAKVLKDKAKPTNPKAQALKDEAKSINEEEILNELFKPFENKKVTRRREGCYQIRNWGNEGMGYWRGISAVGINPITDPKNKKSKMFYDSVTNTHIPRQSRTILKYGEFRCGEWSDFLTYIALSQGISDLTQLAIYSGIGYNTDYYYTLNRVTGAANYIHPSLGSLSRTNSNLANWVFYVKGGWTFNDPNKPTLTTSTTNRAQGNTNPLHYFSDHVFMVYENGTSMKFYDPSYGILAKKNATTYTDVIKDYCLLAIDAIAYYNLGTKDYKTIRTGIEKHLVTRSTISLFHLMLKTVYHTGIVAIIDTNGNTIKTF